MTDMNEDDMLPPPPEDDVAPDFGGWECFTLLGLKNHDERYIERAIADPQFELNTQFEYVISFFCFSFFFDDSVTDILFPRYTQRLSLSCVSERARSRILDSN